MNTAAANFVRQPGGRSVATAGRILRAAATAPKTCVKCKENPVLGALTRCAGCLKADADIDRKARERVAFAPEETPSILEHEADALLADPAAILALEQAGVDLRRSNDARGRLVEMLGHDRDRQGAAPGANAVRHTLRADGSNGLDVALAEPRNTAVTAGMAEGLGRMLECPVYRIGEARPDQFADRPLLTTPKHEFGREVKKRRSPTSPSKATSKAKRVKA